MQSQSNNPRPKLQGSVDSLPEPTDRIKRLAEDFTPSQAVDWLRTTYTAQLGKDYIHWSMATMPFMWSWLWCQELPLSAEQCAVTVYWWNRTSKLKNQRAKTRHYKQRAYKAHDKDAKIIRMVAAGRRQDVHPLITRLCHDVMGFLVDSIINTTAKIELCEHEDTHLHNEEWPMGGVIEICNVCGKSRLHAVKEDQPGVDHVTDWVRIDVGRAIAQAQATVDTDGHQGNLFKEEEIDGCA